MENTFLGNNTVWYELDRKFSTSSVFKKIQGFSSKNPSIFSEDPSFERSEKYYSIEFCGKFGTIWWKNFHVQQHERTAVKTWTQLANIGLKNVPLERMVRFSDYLSKCTFPFTGLYCMMNSLHTDSVWYRLLVTMSLKKWSIHVTALATNFVPIVQLSSSCM